VDGEEDGDLPLCGHVFEDIDEDFCVCVYIYIYVCECECEWWMEKRMGCVGGWVVGKNVYVSNNREERREGVKISELKSSFWIVASLSSTHTHNPRVV
jgi:hypothetical protein